MPRLAIISTAHIHTKSFIEAILNATDGRIVAAVWDEQVDRGRRYAEAARAPFVESLEDLLADDTIDGYIICAENTRHLPLLRQVLPLGKPVFCEKPLVTNLEDLAVVQALLAEYRPKVFCGYFQPFEATMQTVAGLVAENAFGRITRVRYRNAHHAAYGRWFDHPDLAWFHDPALAGGGAFMDMGTHALHLVRTLFGPVARVWASIRNESGIYPACDDYGLAQLELRNGIWATVEAGWTQTGGLGGLEIVGESRALWLTPDGYVIGAPKQEPEPLVVRAVGVPSRVDRLVAAIRGELNPEALQADLAATLDTVELMAAAYRSTASGQWEQV